MEEFVARCGYCGQVMTTERIINNGAVVLTVLCRCPHCGKEYIAEFDKFSAIDQPELMEIDENGLDPDGYDAEGYDKDGLDPRGFDRAHIHHDTSSPYDSSGYDWEGYDSDGLDKRGFDRDGYYKKTESKYNKAGFDWHGYGKDGYNEFNIDKYGKHREAAVPLEYQSGQNKKGCLNSIFFFCISLFIIISLFYSF
jgi:hypothetical protein